MSQENIFTLQIFRLNYNDADLYISEYVVFIFELTPAFPKLLAKPREELSKDPTLDRVELHKESMTSNEYFVARCPVRIGSIETDNNSRPIH